jgi:hypothetical protein
MGIGYKGHHFQLTLLDHLLVFKASFWSQVDNLVMELITYQEVLHSLISLIDRGLIELLRFLEAVNMRSAI